MDSRNGNAAAAAASPLPQYLRHALLALPDLDRPPAVMEMWELEAVAAALPAKKRRLRETFDRLAASAPAPLPFRWEDLDAYISSLQFSATLRHRQQRELGGPRPSPAPAAVSVAPPATGEDGVHPIRALEKSSRPVDVYAHVPMPPVVSEPPIAATGDVRNGIRALEEPEPGHAPAPAPPAPAAMSAPAATGVDVGKGKKRKASSSQEADAVVRAAIRVPQEALHVQMPNMNEDAAAAASPLTKDMSCNGDKSRPVPPDTGDHNGLAAAAAASATAQVDPVPVSKIAVVVAQELRVPAPAPGPAAAASARHPSDARRARPAGRLPPQRSLRPPHHVAGSQEAEAANNQNTQVQANLAAVRVPQEALHVQTPEMHEDAAAAAAASPSKDMNCNGDKSRPVPPGPAGGNGLAADARAQADPVPVSKIAVVVPLPQELPAPAPGPAAAPARHASNAASRARPAGRLPPQRRRRPPLPVPAASAAASAATVAGSQEAEAANQNNDLPVATKTSRDGGEAEASPCRPGRGTMAQVGVDPIGKIAGVRHESGAASPHATINAAASPTKLASFTLMARVVPKQKPQGVEEEEVPNVEMEIVEAEEPKQERPNDEARDVEMEVVEPEEMPALFEEDAPVANEKASPLQVIKAQEVDKVSPLALACSNGSLALQAGVQQVDAASATVRKSSPAAMHDAPNVLHASASKSAATGLTLAGSKDEGGKVSPPVPPRGGDGLHVQPGVSTDETMQMTVAARKSAPAGRHSSPAATRRGANATGLAPAAGREPSGPPQAMAPPKASNKHVLQKQHMPKQAYHEPISSSAQKQNHSFSRNHGGRPAGSQPVPEAQAAAVAKWNKNPGEGRGGPGHGGFAAARGLQGDGGSRSNKGYNTKWKPPMFCNKCGCRGHLAETCRTAKHLVALYLRAKEEEANQICYRCGCTGHWSRKCRTPKHLVDLYQKDRAAKRAAQGTGSP